MAALGRNGGTRDQTPMRNRRSVTQVLIRAGSAVLIAAVVIFVGSSAASAHSGDQSYLYLDVTERTLTGRIEIPMVDLREVLDFELEGDDAQNLAEVTQKLGLVHNYLAEHLVLGPIDDGDGRWDIAFGEAELFFSDDPEIDDQYIVVPFDVDVTGGDVPRRFDVQLDLFFDEIDGRDHLLLIGNDWRAGVIDNGRDDLATFDNDTRSQAIDLGAPSAFRNFRSSVTLGVNHIQTGPDHILFVLVLLLPSVLVFRAASWRPTDRFVAALWRVLKIVTMFTIAHSITFTLAGLGLVPLPSPRIVESIIALSIAAAAVHNIWPLAGNREWLLAFAFGLFHGMGFASLVSGLDVSRDTQLVSLLGRNVGIEIGQAAVVVLLFPALFLLRRTKIYRPFFVAVSLLLAGVSVLWMVERLFETDVGINAYVDPVFVWPRVVYYIAAFTMMAAALFLFERSNGRLIPLGSSGDTEDGDTEDGGAKRSSRAAPDDEKARVGQ